MAETRCMGCMRPIRRGEARCPACGVECAGHVQPKFALSLGTQLHAGKYLIGRVLGQGGFGITYAGLDQSLELKVAVKEYFPTSMASRPTGTAALQWHSTAEQHETGRDSFVKEARKMAKIHHIPNVVEVRDVFYENDTAYIVMDFVEGETLKDRLAKTGPMGETDCVALLRPVMEALGKAHERGIIHRDISPDNIMIDGSGAPWLLDMGAAKELDFTPGGGMQSSQLVVKHGFSPPEQSTSAGRIGPWTDVYAMCATIYYCITGKVLPDAMERMLGTPLTLLSLLSENLAAALERGLALRPEDRIQSMDALMAELSELRATQKRRPEKALPVSSAVDASGAEAERCPGCGAVLVLSHDKRKRICNFCGNTYPVRNTDRVPPIQAATDAKVVSLFVEAAKHRQKGDYASEINVLASALEISPDNTMALVKLGRAYRAMNFHAKAVECYEKAIEIDPQYGPAYINLGAIYLLSRDYQRASGYYEKGLELADKANTSDYAIGLANYALVTGHLGDKKKAVSLLEEAEKKGYTNGKIIREELNISVFSKIFG